MIRAFIYLAVQPERAYTGAAAIARAIKAPENYLGKVLQQFAVTGILKAARGLHGGLRLGVPATEITLLRIVEVVERLDRQPKCFMGQLCCGPLPCDNHARWVQLHQDYVNFLGSLTIADLVKQNQINGGHFIMPPGKREELYANDA